MWFSAPLPFDRRLVMRSCLLTRDKANRGGFFLCLAQTSRAKGPAPAGLRISGPDLVLHGDSLWLNCTDDAGGEPHRLWWYKDNVQFYSYERWAEPPVTGHNLPGVHVDLALSREGFVHLLLADAQTQGTYRCDLALEPGVVPEHARLTVRVIGK